MEQRVETPAKIEARRRSSGLFAWVVFCLITAAIAAALWWQRQAPAEGPVGGHAASAPSVGAATVSKGNIDVTVSALGTVTSLATVTVKSQISGQLIAVHFQEGQEVSKGDLLAEIDPRPYEAALAQAKGQLARDAALLADAQLDLKRDQDLVTKNAQTQQAVDAQAALVGQYRGTVESDNALVQAANISLDYTRITSPIDGRAGLRQVDAGNYATAGDTAGIVVITQLQPISVLFTVPEDELPAISTRVAQGASLPVQAFDRSGQTKLAQGTLATFDSQIDPTTGTIKLRGSFANTERNLYPNQFVNITLTVDEHTDVAILPMAAVQRGAPGTFVYLINADSTVSVRKVTLGVSEGERVEITSGVAPGDRVVVDGADKLREGAKVTLAPAGPSP